MRAPVATGHDACLLYPLIIKWGILLALEHGLMPLACRSRVGYQPDTSSSEAPSTDDARLRLPQTNDYRRSWWVSVPQEASNRHCERDVYRARSAVSGVSSTLGSGAVFAAAQRPETNEAAAQKHQARRLRCGVCVSS